MASELFLGPDGGPYVSVNENSGDIELKDNSGNVVAFWDESATQWDVQSNDIQNVGSLGVDNQTISESFRAETLDPEPLGSTTPLIDDELSTSGQTWGHRYANNVGEIDGDNNPVTISSEASNRTGGFFIVSAIDRSDSTTGFSDLINVALASSITVFNSQARGSVGTRSYSSSNGFLELAIDDSGVTYVVSVTNIGGAR